ncbi:MAG: SAM-dependent chlorinase/fluorinase [Nanoarchaeota archaeon]|nr:SAM-dependent chlorinase/fluorinase [Nanoarchaeota archaeon]
MKHIVLITDCIDVASEQIKARLSKLLGEKNIDYKIYNAFTPPFQITNGMFLTKLLFDEVPKGKDTLYLAILNPLKEKPKRIFGKLENGSYFVGADTGLFSLIFKSSNVQEVWETKNLGHYPFGGLHVHSVAAAKLLMGDNFEKVGNKLELENIKIYEPKEGEVVHIDNFGLSKIWLRESDLKFEEDTPIKIKVYNFKGELKSEFNGIYSNRMMDYEDNQIIAYPGSALLDSKLKENNEKYRKSGLIEIGMVRNSESSKYLNISLGDLIEITTKDN